MRFYTQLHQHYCGIDLHARTIYLRLLNPAGEILLTATSGRPRRRCSKLSPRTGKISWSPSSACSPGTGSPISAPPKVKCAKESAGTIRGNGGTKIGNAHLKWAFSEAAVGFLRKNPEGKAYYERHRGSHINDPAVERRAHFSPGAPSDQTTWPRSPPATRISAPRRRPTAPTAWLASAPSLGNSREGKRGTENE